MQYIEITAIIQLKLIISLIKLVVQNDVKISEYVGYVASTFKQQLDTYSGDINKAKVKTWNSLDVYNSENPLKFAHDENMYLFNGLTICMDNVWGHNITIEDCKYINSDMYSFTLHFKLYDHFGLDPNDVSGFYGSLEGFRAWFALQHYDMFNGRYKPFINIIEFEVKVTGGNVSG